MLVYHDGFELLVDLFFRVVLCPQREKNSHLLEVHLTQNEVHSDDQVAHNYLRKKVKIKILDPGKPQTSKLIQLTSRASCLSFIEKPEPWTTLRFLMKVDFPDSPVPSRRIL